MSPIPARLLTKISDANISGAESEDPVFSYNEDDVLIFPAGISC